MPLPELSVIIPTHGRAEQVSRAVASALAQDVDLEVVVVDDASPQPIQAADGRVQVVRLAENGGPAAARNAGVAQAKAEWIAFLDSDDVWTPGSLRARLDEAQSAQDAERTIWAAGFIDVWPSGRRSARLPKASERAIDFASGCWMCPGSTALFSRVAWLRSGGQDANLRRLEDYDWLLRWASAGGRLAVHGRAAAEIARGPRASPQSVGAAAVYLRRKHASMPDAMRRRIESYLALELSVSRLHVGDALGGASAMTRSLLFHPRLHAPLERFWSAAPE